MPHLLRKAIPVSMLGLLCGSILIMSSVPPVSRDALTHHLAVPKLYLVNQGLVELPDIPFSYYPQLIDLLYCVPLVFGNDIIPKYIHFLFALLTAFLIFHHLKNRLSTPFALWSSLFFLSLPVIVRLSTTVYVDLGLIFFSTASLLLLLRWREDQYRYRCFFASALCCGLALSTKYNGLISLLLICFLIPFIDSDQISGKKARRQLKHLCLFLITALIIFSPWMVKNVIWTGNPVYPLYDRIFHSQETVSEEEQPPSLNHFAVRKLVFHEKWFETASIPIRIFFQGEDDNPRLFDGRLNPLLFLLPLAAMMPLPAFGKRIPEKKILAAFSVLYILIAFLEKDMRIRWIGPAIPPLVILSAYGAHHLFSQFSEKLKIMLVLVLISFASLNFIYMHQLFIRISPMGYLTGKISRDAYIQKFRPEYGALQYVNKNLGKDTKILAFFLGNRRYYSDHDIDFDYFLFQKLIRKHPAPDDLRNALRQEGITTFIVNLPSLNHWMQTTFKKEVQIQMKNFFSTQLDTLYFSDHHAVYQLK